MATYGANDALYGTGTFGTARYGRVTPIIAVTGVVGTSAIGTVTPKAEVSLTATGVSATGSVGEVEEQPTEALESVSATGSIGTPTVTASATLMGAYNPEITSILFAKVALETASITSADAKIAEVAGASLAAQNVASSRVVAEVLEATGSSGVTNQTLALTGGDQVQGSVQGAVGTGTVGALSTSATVFDFEAVKALYSRRRTILVPKAA